MTSSLVGSEMCIRDSQGPGDAQTTEAHGLACGLRLLARHATAGDMVRSVSYTHLTLPTICSV
eukprot:1681579-Prorocentrum_lima.AAC.1